MCEGRSEQQQQQGADRSRHWNERRAEERGKGSRQSAAEGGCAHRCLAHARSHAATAECKSASIRCRCCGSGGRGATSGHVAGAFDSSASLAPAAGQAEEAEEEALGEEERRTRALMPPLRFASHRRMLHRQWADMSFDHRGRRIRIK